MGMVIQGVELDDKQLAAIVPVIHRYSKKRMIPKDKLQMEKDCLDAMKTAGCPLIQPPAQ